MHLRLLAFLAIVLLLPSTASAQEPTPFIDFETPLVEVVGHREAQARCAASGNWTYHCTWTNVTAKLAVANITASNALATGCSDHKDAPLTETCGLNGHYTPYGNEFVTASDYHQANIGYGIDSHQQWLYIEATAAGYRLVRFALTP